MVNLKDVFYSLLNRVDTVEEDWEKAYEAKQAELLEVSLKRQDKENAYGDMQRLVLLNQVTEATFEKEKAELDGLKAKEVSLHNDMALIQQYKVVDVSRVVEEIAKARNNAHADTRKEVTQLRYDLVVAKQAYLKAITDASRAYSKLAQPERKFQELMVLAGKQKHLPMIEMHYELGQIDVGVYGYAGLEVDYQAVQSAYSGMIPHQLDATITQGKRLGFIVDEKATGLLK